MFHDRYSRQRLFAGIGDAGQERIRQSSVAVAGCGALGTVSAEMLARAGVGTLTLIDRDYIEPSNLQRQSLFTEADAKAGIPKAAAAREALLKINSETKIRAHVLDLSPETIEPALAGSDLIIDGTDNFETRYLINDFSFKNAIPWIYGGCVGSFGSAYAFRPGRTPCLRCLFPESPAPGTIQTCDTAGIIAPAVHAVSAFQAAQALKVLTGTEPGRGIFQIDVWEDVSRLIPTPEVISPDCDCCQRRRFRYLEGDFQDQVVRLCGRDAVQVSPRRAATVDFRELSLRFAHSGIVDFNEYMMRIEIDGYQIALFPDGRSIIKGTDDPSRARSVYAKYIGS